jgi:pimeloyl-ACP methyl ester carboxylesterase
MTGPPTSVAVTTRGHGPAVLALHGLGGDHQQALSLIPEDIAVMAIAPDMPGHGNTDLSSDEPLGFTEFAAHAANVLDQMRSFDTIASAPIPVVGISMGAGVALALAAARPDLVSHAALVRPAWFSESPAPNLAALIEIGRCLQEFGVVRGEAAYRASAVFAELRSLSAAVADGTLGQFVRLHAAERSRVLREMPYSLPIPAAEYHRVAVPATVIGAPDDPIHPIALARTVVATIPHARFVEAPAKLADPAAHLAVVHRTVREIFSAPQLP